jgi:superfamily II DNA or RNA helicase
MGLSDLFTKKHYELPEDDIIHDLIIPAMKISDEVLIESAYFSNHGLAQIAPGLSELIQSDHAKIKLLISLKGFSDTNTIDAISESSFLETSDIEDLFRKLLEACRHDRLHEYAKDCLTYLLATGKAELRLVDMVNKSGIWHCKTYIFKSEDQLIISGSANCTYGGFVANGEVLNVSIDPKDDFHIKRFHKTWNGNKPHSITHIPSPELMEEIKRIAPDKAPNPDLGAELLDEQILKATRISSSARKTDLLEEPEKLTVPTGLNYSSGKYAHQGTALTKLESNNYSGMLSIATGGGKTKTALIAASQIQDRTPHLNTAMLVLVPTGTLLDMWEMDVRDFGCTAVNLSKLGGSKKRNAYLYNLNNTLKNNENSKTVILLSTMQLFVIDDTISEFFKTLDPEKTQKIIIGDEAHRLGSKGFKEINPSYFDYKVGLSATPTRAFDEEGSEFLNHFFGTEIYNFDLKAAIAAGCLTPYIYTIHLCSQSEKEFDEFVKISAQIARLYGVNKESDSEMQESLQTLLFKRTALIEQTESKIQVLDTLISKNGQVNKALFFASAGSRNPNINPEGEKQLDKINAILLSHSINFHQLTSEESGKGHSQEIQTKFARNEYQAISSMRVLDEGVDLPMAETAYLVGSSKSAREWIQRRGRILRNHPGKELAVVHDFVTVPFDSSNKDGQWIIKSEAERITEFTMDSLNSYSDNEGWDALEEYRNQ